MAERAAADKLQEDRDLRRPSWDYNITPMTAVRTLCRLVSMGNWQRVPSVLRGMGDLLEVAYAMCATVADPALAVSTHENCTTGDGP